MPLIFPPTPARRAIWRQRGVVLVAVLWVAIFLALLSAQVSQLSRSDLYLARNLAEGTRAELAADRALWTAVYAMINGASEPWRLDGSVYAWRIGDAEVRVRVTDEHGRIDINASGAPLLGSLFRVVGLDREEAESLALAVETFREGGASVSRGTAAAGRPDRSGQQFAAIEELLLVPGISPRIFDRVAPAITVHGRQGWPFEDSASPLVLAAMEGRVPDGEGWEEPPPMPAAELESLVPTPEFLSGPSIPREIRADFLRIEAEAVTPDGFHYAREAIASFGTRSDPPWQFFRWRRGGRTLFPPASGS